MKNSALIIAHRGESYDAPENTLAAINLAWQRGAKAVEIDIQLTADGEIVVFHDTNTKRITGINKALKKQTLSELKVLDAGSFKSVGFKGEPIPTLQEVLQTIPVKAKLIIEIKSGDEIIAPLLKIFKNNVYRPEQIEFIAFNYQLICKLKKFLPKYTMLWLLDLDYYLPWWLVWKSTGYFIKKALSGNIDGLDVWAGKMLTEKCVNKIISANLKLYAWTVNNPAHATVLINRGVHGITTDRANFISEKLQIL